MNSAWRRLTRTVAPTATAISLATAKDHLRVDHEADDPLIESMIETATAMLEGPHGIGLAIITQTWRMVLDESLPLPLELPLGPVQAVTSLTYVDPDGNTQTLASSVYVLLNDRQPAILELAADMVLPSIRRQLSAATVTFTAGYGATAADVPADLRAAMLLMIGHLYHHREAVSTARSAVELPMGYLAITDRYRAGRFG